MLLYLVKGYLDVAATSLADAQALLAALADPSDATNAAAIDRVVAKLPTLVQSDTGEPLTISSIDDTGGTISSWVTDGSTTVTVALGDTDPSQSFLYASATGLTVSGSTRVGTLDLDIAALARAVSLAGPRPAFSLQVRKTTSGIAQTMALLRVQVLPGVIA